MPVHSWIYTSASKSSYSTHETCHFGLEPSEFNYPGRRKDRRGKETQTKSASLLESYHGRNQMKVPVPEQKRGRVYLISYPIPSLLSAPANETSSVPEHLHGAT